MADSLSSFVSMGSNTVDVLGAVKQGMGLAQQAGQLQQQRQQLEADKDKLEQAKFDTLTGHLNLLAKSTPQVAKRLVPAMVDNARRRGIAVDPEIYSAVAQDDEEKRNVIAAMPTMQEMATDPVKRTDFMKKFSQYADAKEVIDYAKSSDVLQQKTTSAEAKAELAGKLLVYRTERDASKDGATNDARENRNLLQANRLYDSNMKTPENGLHSASRALDIVNKVDSGELFANKMLRGDLTSQLGTLTNNGKLNTVYSTSEQELSSAYQNVKDKYNYLTGKATNTLPQDQLNQLKKDIQALQIEYGQQHERTYTALRRRLPDSTVPKLDDAYNQSRTNFGLNTLGQSPASSASATQTATPQTPTKDVTQSPQYKKMSALTNPNGTPRYTDAQIKAFLGAK